MGKHLRIQTLWHHVHQSLIFGQHNKKTPSTSSTVIRRSQHTYWKRLHLETGNQNSCIKNHYSQIMQKTVQTLTLLFQGNAHSSPPNLKHPHHKLCLLVNTISITLNQGNPWDVMNVTASLTSSGTVSYMFAHYVDKDSLDTLIRKVLSSIDKLK